MDLQHLSLQAAEGEFTLVHGMAYPGSFHLHLVNADKFSDDFANVYFGTGGNVWRGKR
jgi:hypothetical protein